MSNAYLAGLRPASSSGNRSNGNVSYPTSPFNNTSAANPSSSGGVGSRHGTPVPSSANSSGSRPTSRGEVAAVDDASANATSIAGMRIKKGKLLGKGAFGSVFQAMNTMSGELLAIKQLPIAHDVTSHTLRGIEREIAINSSLPPHPNCVKYLGVQSTQRNIYIVMEYVSGGSIQSLLQSVGQFHERTMRSYSKMILNGLKHLHSNNVIHQDIKGANVLIDEKGVAKIADFGCSKDLSTAGGGVSSTSEGAIGGGAASSTFHNAGTPLWMAPEVCRGEPATKHSDVWSFGCLLLEMVTPERSPWVFAPGTSAFAVLYAIGAASKPPQPPSHLSPLARDFVSKCLILDASKRPTVDELLQHPFITGKGVAAGNNSFAFNNTSSDSGQMGAGLTSGLSSSVGSVASQHVRLGNSASPLQKSNSGGKGSNTDLWASEWEGGADDALGRNGQRREHQPASHYDEHPNSNPHHALGGGGGDFISSPFLTRGPGGDTIGIMPQNNRQKLNLREKYLNPNGPSYARQHNMAGDAPVDESFFMLQAVSDRDSVRSAGTVGGASYQQGGGNQNPGARSAEFVLNAVDDDDDDEDTGGDGYAQKKIPVSSQHQNDYLTNQYQSWQRYDTNNLGALCNMSYSTQKQGVAENFGSDDEEDGGNGNVHKDVDCQGTADDFPDDEEDEANQLMLAGEANARRYAQQQEREYHQGQRQHHQRVSSSSSNLASSSAGSPHQHHYYYQSGGSGMVPASPAMLSDSGNASPNTSHMGHSGSVYTYGQARGLHHQAAKNTADRTMHEGGTVVWHSSKCDAVDASSNLFHTEEVGTGKHRQNGVAAETNKIASFFSKKFKCMNPTDSGKGK